MFATFAAILAQSNLSRQAPWPVYVIIIAVSIVAASASSWQFFVQWLNGVRGRNWPTVSAVIDLVSVQKREESGRAGPIVTYVAMLTYVYHNPDLQTGDYDRSFNDREEAEAWASSFRGCTVMVHVHPRDPSRSALRAQDLDAAVSQLSSPVPRDPPLGEVHGRRLDGYQAPDRG